MADRYYIGARYVPAVYEGPDGSNTWLPGVAYDGLVIVTYGNYSYMSKKPVPAGMDPPDVNTAYWIKAAVYNADVKNVVEQLENKADKDGVYPDLFAGNLISDQMRTDNAPYLERETAGGLSGIAPLCYPTLVGASVAENQLCNGESVTVTNGHKYYLKKSGAESLGASAGSAITGLTSGSDMVIDLTQMLGSAIADYAYSLDTNGIAWLRSYGFLGGYQAYNSGSIESVEVTGKKCVGFNQWDEEWRAGTISNPSATNCICSKNYCPILPNTTYYATCGKTDGGSQNKYYLRVMFYDSYKNNIGGVYTNNLTFVTPNNATYFQIETNTSTVLYGNVYHHDICINLSNPDRNGEYEPYKSITYPLGSDVLRGIFKLDANNKLYADGDRKEADGTITRKYGVVDLGTLSWSVQSSDSNKQDFLSTSLNGLIKTVDEHTMPNIVCSLFNVQTRNEQSGNPSANYRTIGVTASGNLRVVVAPSSYLDAATFKEAMSGVYLVYELATPTTEQSTPFASPQVCYPDGTEEFVTENDVPVGNETEYPYDLKGILEKLAEVPAADGTYTLKATRSGANITYTWDQEV